MQRKDGTWNYFDKDRELFSNFHLVKLYKYWNSMLPSCHHVFVILIKILDLVGNNYRKITTCFENWAINYTNYLPIVLLSFYHALTAGAIIID